MNKKEVPSKSGGVSDGDNAQSNVTITGGEHQTQGERSAIVEANSGEIHTGDKNIDIQAQAQSGGQAIGHQEIEHQEIHYHHYPQPEQALPPRAENRKGRRVFSTPVPHNDYFIGREDILSAIETDFESDRRVQAINGIGGIGKTQTAVEYAYRHRDDYNAVLWGRAHTRETLTSDFAAMAGLLDLPEKNADDQDEAVKAVKRWLDGNGGWLLILDNADDLRMAREFIPTGGDGHILLTTRSQATGAIATRHPLEKMSPLDGSLFLLRRSKTIAVDAASDAARADQREQAEVLSKLLDGLPLALDQAAAYIEEKPSTIARYIELYRAAGVKLRARRGDYHDDHPESVSVTFSLAFEKVMNDSPAAADLLRVCAFLEADAIPEEIFRAGAGELGEAIRSAAAELDGLIDAIGEAGRFSLLRYEPEAGTVSVHRLVQEVLRDGIDDETRRVWAERAVRAVNEAFPSVEYASWSACERLIQHSKAGADLIDTFAFEFSEAARLLHQAGHYLYERAQYAEAEPLFQRALVIREKALGPDHLKLAATLNNLAELYREQGKYVEAKPLFQRALAICENARSPDHPSLATMLNNLAELYREQAKYAKAEPLYQRALAIYEQALGPDHPKLATTLNNLALLYREQGKYVEAEPLYQRALAVYEQARGPDHPKLATALNNLAELYRQQGKYVEAEPLYQRALAICENARGPAHPELATMLNNLALFYEGQRKYVEAEPLFQRALAICEKVLGPAHPSLAMTLTNLANLYQEQGKYVEAEPLYQRALAIYEQALGLAHPELATTLNNLAELCRRQRKYAEAEPLFQRALEIKEKALGPDHPKLAATLNNLALLYEGQRKYVEAEPLYQRALAIYEQALGPAHPSVVTVRENYANLLRKMNHDHDTVTLEARTTGIRTKAGPKVQD